jgi:hypothetical protein
MTNEVRARCVEAIARTIAGGVSETTEARAFFRELAANAFDALHGIVRIMPLEGLPEWALPDATAMEANPPDAVVAPSMKTRGA